jgi:hypothetical protein
MCWLPFSIELKRLVYFASIWLDFPHFFCTCLTQFGQMHRVLFTFPLNPPTSAFLLSVPIPISIPGDVECSRCSRLKMYGSFVVRYSAEIFRVALCRSSWKSDLLLGGIVNRG